MKRKTLLILTLKKHEDGLWIRRLVQSLQATAKDHQVSLSNEAAGTETTPQNTPEESSSHLVTIRVQPLEEWLAQGWLVSSPPSFFENLIGIVNRVSDAASPPLFKAACAILGAAQQLLQIPIVNGPTTYSLCGNKWCHHIFFQQAGLESPKTLAYWNDDEDKGNGNIGSKLEALTTNGMQENKKNSGTDLLVKPNSGGFGAGIQRVKTPLNDESLPVFEDSITLVQDYHPPKDNQLYRIWFLLGKVQCAVVRSITDSSGNDEFTNACSGTCSIEKPPSAWPVPHDVRKELEDQLLPLLTDAHCGSVEFLYTQDGSKRLYFDLNLLSTLPTRVSNTKGVWADDYDPWMELANAVWKVVAKKEES
mmetsp:Transcript_38741/g.93654  ORF Transcript_38741/g.93654 Transcript_38741/m.93654 type:complete len:364 (-) Transcript_38741:729-1820(-)